MTMLLLILSSLLLLGALGFLASAVRSLVAQVGIATRMGVESVARIKGDVACLRGEGRRLRDSISLVSESASGWPQGLLLFREALLLLRSIRAMMTVTALLSTLRRAPW